MSILTPPHNKHVAMPFLIKLEAESDQEPLICCDYKQKLEDLKLKSSHSLQSALEAKSDEIQILNKKRKQLLLIEKNLSSEISLLRNKIKNLPVETFDSSDEEEADDRCNLYRSIKRVIIFFFKRSVIY